MRDGYVEEKCPMPRLIAAEPLKRGQAVVPQGEFFAIEGQLAFCVVLATGTNGHPIGVALDDYEEGDEVGILTKITKMILVKNIPGLTLPPPEFGEECNPDERR
jgi:hypothetical protein